MPATLDHIHPGTPMGANLIADDATFRVWAPHARSVHVLGDFNNRQRNDVSLLTRDAHGHWRGFIPGVRDRQRYMFYLVGEGSEGLQRDPAACSSKCVGHSRALECQPCVVKQLIQPFCI